MKLDEVIKDIPAGRFRVIGRDNFDTPRDEQYFVVDDYEQRHEAVAIARSKKQRAPLLKRRGLTSPLFLGCSEKSDVAWQRLCPKGCSLISLTLKEREEHEADGDNEIATTFYVVDSNKILLFGELKLTK